MPSRAIAPQPFDIPEEATEEAAPAAMPVDQDSLAEVLSRLGALDSPVGQLQAALGREYAIQHAGAQSAEERLPLYWTAGLVLVTGGTFWTGLFLLVRGLLR